MNIALLCATSQITKNLILFISDIWNNESYLSSRSLRENYLKVRYIGDGPRSGISIADTLKFCAAYGLPAARVTEFADLDAAIKKALDHEGPYVLEIIIPPEQPIVPTVSSRDNSDGSMTSRLLEVMAPFLDHEEYRSNLLIQEV